MPERVRTVLAGFEPMLVRGYVRTGARALWFYLSDKTFKEYNPGTEQTVKGTLNAIYYPTGEMVAEPKEEIEWKTSATTGYSVTIPNEVITKYKLTSWHFIDVTIDEIAGEKIYPGETVEYKIWPEDKMKLESYLEYIE